MTALLIAALALPPHQAVTLAAWLTGAPEDDLHRVVWRESRGQRVGIHAGDASQSRHVCERAVAVRWLDEDVDCSAGGWSTRGIGGLMAAYHLRLLGLGRWPWVLDVPLLSAIAMGRKMVTQCPGRAHGWCPGGRDDA